MPAVDTTNRKFHNLEEGAHENTWGELTDENWERLDNILGDVTSIVTNGSTVQLTDDEQDTAVIEINGVLISPAIIEWDGRGGIWLIRNNTTGAHPVTVKVTGQTGFEIEQGTYSLAYADGDLIDVPIRSDLSEDTEPVLGGDLDPDGHGVTGDWLPATSDGAALGDLTHLWSDLFLALGGVINWNNDVFLTHAANTLTFSGGDFVIDPTAGFVLPFSAAPTVNANGEIALDTTVTDFSHGLLRYWGGEELMIVAMPAANFASPTDGSVVTYNATLDEFVLDPDAGGLPGASVAEIFAGTESQTAITPDSANDSGAAVDLGNLTGSETFDFATFINAKGTLTGNVTFSPSNISDHIGRSGWIRLKQDATGSRLLNTTHANLINVNAQDVVLSTTASATDILYYSIVDIDGSAKVLLSLGRAVG